MKKLILALLSSLSLFYEGFSQCTVSNMQVLNYGVSGSNVTFNLSFTHIRNSGNKWVTIHLWSQTGYPHYNYGLDGYPTSLNLDGEDPLGTIVIDNQLVASTGSYTNAFAAQYQNDATFHMLNTTSSVLSYNSSTNIYTISNLFMPNPNGLVEGDVWSSQATGNNVVHCYFQQILPPIITPVTGMETFKARVDSIERKVLFSWTTQMETNNAFFTILWRKSGDSLWNNVALVSSNWESGTGGVPSAYSYTWYLSDYKLIIGSLFIFPLLGGLIYTRKRQFCLVALLFIASTLSIISCKKTSSSYYLPSGKYEFRLKQTDKDGRSSYSDVLMLRI
jgi:hypothetical protein